MSYVTESPDSNSQKSVSSMPNSSITLIGQPESMGMGEILIQWHYANLNPEAFWQFDFRSVG